MSNLTKQEAKGGSPAKPEPMVVVNHVDMIFNIANEQLNSLKEYFIAAVRGKLFFREFKALEDISFTVNRGDVYGIVGTNGSGKSTMLKVIAGVLEPTHGTCEINGTIAPLIELGAGFDPELTARENVYLNGALLGYSKKFIDENFDSIVEFAEVQDFIDMPLKNYSSGMTARIAFAIATATIPDILVVDEALSVGDFMFQEKCERRIDDLVKNHGTTLLFVSHSIDQVERVCEKALWIEKGHMRMRGTVEDVCFAYRNMDYTDFVSDNGILDAHYDDADTLKAPVTVATISDALWRCAGAPETSSPDPNVARAWTVEKGILPAALREDERYQTEATRQDLVDLIYRFALWRKPSKCDFEHIDAEKFSDDLPADQDERDAVEWCVHHKLLGGMKSTDGALSLALDQPASRVALAKMITRLYKIVFAYPDDVSPTDWYVLPGYYDYVVEHGIIGGYPDGLFGPKDPVTHGQAATIVWRCAGKPESTLKELPFADAEAGAYYEDPVRWSLENHLLDGLAENELRPNAPASRQELALLAYRYVRLMGSGLSAPIDDLSTYPDAHAVDPSCREALAWCLKHGCLDARMPETKKKSHQETRIEEADGSANDAPGPRAALLAPAEAATRAEAAKLFAVIQRDLLAR